jgi:cyanophycinase
VARYFSGSPEDVSPPLFGPALDLGGGGADVDAAIQWMIDAARGCSDCPAEVDVVVLRASGADGYNGPILAMRGVNSVTTLVIPSRADAFDPAVEETVRRAEVVFFAGGDQAQYVGFFGGGPVQSAVESVYARGGGVGGTSAGMAIQADVVYDALSGSVTSAEALADPYDARIHFTEDLFSWRDLEATLTDTHFVTRDRMGRLMAFLARRVRDAGAEAFWGVAADEGTSVTVDRDGMARVMGRAAYFVLADHAPEVCEPGQPLTYGGFKIWKVPDGGTFDLRNRPSGGYYERSVQSGVLSSYPYSPGGEAAPDSGQPPEPPAGKEACGALRGRSEQEPRPVTFRWTLTASCGRAACTKTGVVTASTEPFCEIACAAEVPSEARTGEPVTFEGSAAPDHCDGPLVFAWEFGDGSFSGEPAPAHAYAVAGEYAWRFTASSGDDASCVREGMIRVEAAHPPVLAGASFLSGPFRVRLSGSGFQPGAAVFIGDDPAPWAGVVEKGPDVLVLKKGKPLKEKFPRGSPVRVRLRNPDGGEGVTSVTRP